MKVQSMKAYIKRAVIVNPSRKRRRPAAKKRAARKTRRVRRQNKHRRANPLLTAAALNPSKKRKRRRRKSARRAAVKHVRKNFHRKGGESTMAKKRKKSVRRRRKSNPSFGGPVRRHRSHRRNYKARGRHRRNPGSGSPSMSPSSILTLGLGGIGGALIARAVPQAILGANNQGAIGYGSNLITALVASYLAGKFTKNKTLGVAVLVGGLTVTGWRIWQEKVSQTSPSTVMSGMGDLDVSSTGLGEYFPSPYYLPSQSVAQGGNFAVAAAPFAAPAAPAPAGHSLGAPRARGFARTGSGRF
jgi:hypothetical protein